LIIVCSTAGARPAVAFASMARRCGAAPLTNCYRTEEARTEAEGRPKV
jgi:hypothetical protein